MRHTGVPSNVAVPNKKEIFMNAASIALVLEVIMMVLFGFSWPFNVIKSYKARTAKGKSLQFLIIIIVGYIAGITGKILTFDAGEWLKWLALSVYILNLTMVSADLVIYVRNTRLDKEREKNNA